MKIRKINIYLIKLPLMVPYKVSQKTHTEFTPIVIELVGEGDNVGWGEAYISTGYSKETIEDGWTFCKNFACRFVGKESQDFRAALVVERRASTSGASAMLAAIDMLEKNPILQIDESCRFSLLSPCQAHDPEEIKDEVERLIEKGFSTLKIKVGFDVNADLLRVSRIQDAVSGRATLRLDANRAFNRSDGCEFASKLDGTGIELFEQPCASDDWDSNAAVASVSTVPVMLDESIYDVSDIDRAAMIKGVGFVKLKLKKIGSVSMLKSALEKIRKLGMTPVIGDGVSVDLGCWMEACVGRLVISNAGENNGFLKPHAHLFIEPLPFVNGAIELRKDYWPEINRAVLADSMVRAEKYVS